MGVDDDIARALCARDAEVLRLREQNTQLRALLEDAHAAVGVVFASCMEGGNRESAEAWLGLWKRIHEGLSAPVEFSILPMHESEAEVAAALFRKVVEPLTLYNDHAREVELARSDAAALVAAVKDDPDAVLLAWRGGVPVGFITSHNDDGPLWLSWLGVLPEYRKQGLGAALLRAVEQTAHRRGASKVWCDCRTENIASRALLEREGYRLIGEVKQHWHGQDFFLWDKHLPPPPENNG